MASTAMASSSSGVRFWIGCGTQTTAGAKPSERACAAAASRNSVVATRPPGMPLWSS